MRFFNFSNVARENPQKLLKQKEPEFSNLNEASVLCCS